MPSAHQNVELNYSKIYWGLICLVFECTCFLRKNLKKKNGIGGSNGNSIHYQSRPPELIPQCQHGKRRKPTTLSVWLFLNTICVYTKHTYMHAY